ncbi:MAG: carbohydrate binding family 9 domain-containing protein [Rhodothermales bacterium]|nr:carbohydrate binding family 9 domain-containing protein [Rhodothermales bacterium]
MGSVLLLSLAGRPAAAQESAVPLPSVSAGVKAGDVVIDGHIDEEAWQAVPIATGFVQQTPVEGAPATIRTEARTMFDGSAVYVSARMWDPEPSTIARQLVRRDERGQYDDFMVAFDTNLDLRTGYLFAVSAANVQLDMYLYDDGELDGSWDAVWTSAVQMLEDGWSVEMRIPLSQMRYAASPEPQTWGVEYVRHKFSTTEETQFALISQLQSGRVSQFGRLENVVIPRASTRLEVRPYLLSRAESSPKVAGNPFEDGSGFGGRAGFDLRYGIGAQFNLDATINPDFGQVEADPAVINLTAFETFFPERRPFFVEDARIFDFRLSGRSFLFYSRRIGRAPSGRAPDGATFVDEPEAATILGAAKLTGRTSNGLSVGVLTALTQKEEGEAFFQQTDTRARFTVEPRTGFGVVRLQQEFNGGASTVGAIATAMHRGLPEDGSFNFLTSSAFNAGLDWQHQWADREWSFQGYVAGSHIRGDEEALLRVQRSSNHYYQRPDATRLELDPTRTTMSGLDWRATLSRERGRHWTGAVWAAQVTPGFETNDLGFSNRQEVLDGGARIQYQEIQPGRVLRNYRVSAFTFHNWSHEALDGSWSDAHVRGFVRLGADAQFLNYWSVEGSVDYRPPLTNRTATRGGPLIREPASRGFDIGFSTDPRTSFSFGPRVEYAAGTNGSGDELSFGFEAEYRPSPRVEVGLTPIFGRSTNPAQYVTSIADAAYVETFGRRYIFGYLERSELSVETRIDVALNPRLSLQVYAQPLLSAGDYTSYRQLVRAMSFDFDDFREGTPAGSGCSAGRTCREGDTRYFDFDGDGVADASTRERDFNVRSLIGNAVLRWEYRPGSTLFLVWQRQQSDRIVQGDFSFRRDVDALLGADAYNVVMLKLNYWFGV